MNSETEEFTSEQDAALRALLANNTIEAAARQAGISSRTLRRYMQRPAFAEALRAARRETVRGISKRLQDAAVEAVDTLRAVMKDESAPGPRVTAARCILELSFKAAELEEVEQRIAALEDRVASKAGDVH
jgi:hypothetical protein